MILRRISVVFRWTARILGGALLLLFLAFALGEGFGEKPPSSTELTMFGCLGVMSLGVLVAYWREIIGCILLLFGYAGFAIWDRSLNLGNPFVLFPVVAILYALAWGSGRSRGIDR
jgi:hypothetical protein